MSLKWDAVVVGAKGIGATAVLVRTGKHRDEDLRRSAAQPDPIIDALPDLVGYV